MGSLQSPQGLPAAKIPILADSRNTDEFDGMGKVYSALLDSLGNSGYALGMDLPSRA